jgi:hypothetical protein
MLGSINFKLLRKLLILGVLSSGLFVAFSFGTGQTRASLICCDLCEPNYWSCLATCGVDDKCPELCEETRQQCMISCGVGEC